MRGLRVDTFNIFNNRPQLWPGREASFNHNRSPAARPRLDEGTEILYFQWLNGAILLAVPLPPVTATGYPRSGRSARQRLQAPPNLKQVNPYGGH
jgi:hypothetical protein